MPKKTQHQIAAAWVFGFLFFTALCVVLFTTVVKTDDPLKRQVVFLFCSLMGGLFATFLTGTITVSQPWGKGKKNGISAAGGFALAVVIWVGLNKGQPTNQTSTQQPPKQQTRLSIGIRQYEVDGPGNIIAGAQFNAEGDDVADSLLEKASSWTAAQIKAICPQTEPEWRYEISYRKNHPILTSPVFLKTNASVSFTILPPSLAITPTNAALRIYYWLIVTGTRKEHVLFENAKEYFEQTSDPIWLQFQQPGYEIKLAQLLPGKQTNVSIVLPKTPLSLVVEGEPALGGSVGRLIARLREKGIRASDKTLEDRRQQVIRGKYLLTQPAQAQVKLAALRDSRIDFLVAIAVEHYSK